MRIVTLSNCPLVESQGAGYVVLRYARALRSLGHAVELAGPETFEPWPALGRARRWRLALGMVVHALRHRLYRGADVIEVYGAESWLLVLLLRLTRTRALLAHHANGLETLHLLNLSRHGGRDTLSGAPRRWYQPRAARLLEQSFTRVDALVVVSHAEHRHALAARYQPTERLLAIENPLPEAFLARPLQLDRPRALGWCGAWLWTKGTKLLVACVDALLARYPEVTFHIAGVGTGFDARRVFDPAVCERITVVPFLASKETLRAWYETLSILLVTSYSESFGLVTAEAMACGCAVVATPTGYAADLRDGDEAIVVGEYSAEALVEGASRLLADEELRRRVAKGGHRRAQSLQWGDAGRRLEAFYRERIDASRARRMPPSRRASSRRETAR